MKLPILSVVVLCAAVVIPVFSQTTAPSLQTSSQLRHVETSRAFASLLDLMEAEVMPVARAMPADRYNFSPADLALPNANFKGTRTFAEQVKHIAQSNYAIFSEAGGIEPDRDVKSIATLRTKDEIVAALANSITFARKAVAQLSPTKATLVITGPEPVNREAMVAHGISHAYDHYGQMVEYLRMNGIVPPASAK